MVGLVLDVVLVTLIAPVATLGRVAKSGGCCMPQPSAGGRSLLLLSDSVGAQEQLGRCTACTAALLTRARVDWRQRRFTPQRRTLQHLRLCGPHPPACGPHP